jgi:hypothetical protein
MKKEGLRKQTEAKHRRNKVDEEKKKRAKEKEAAKFKHFEVYLKPTNRTRYTSQRLYSECRCCSVLLTST